MRTAPEDQEDARFANSQGAGGTGPGRENSRFKGPAVRELGWFPKQLECRTMR